MDYTKEKVDRKIRILYLNVINYKRDDRDHRYNRDTIKVI